MGRSTTKKKNSPNVIIGKTENAEQRNKNQHKILEEGVEE